MKFYLKRLPAGRIYVSQIAPTESEEVLQELDADSWISARAMVPSDFMEHREGHGYFA
jgi:hypothetical protein